MKICSFCSSSVNTTETERQEATNYKCYLAVCAALVMVGGLFLLLAAYQVLPSSPNAISRIGPAGIVIGVGTTVIGALGALFSLALSYKNEPQPAPTPAPKIDVGCYAKEEWIQEMDNGLAPLLKSSGNLVRSVVLVSSDPNDMVLPEFEHTKDAIAKSLDELISSFIPVYEKRKIAHYVDDPNAHRIEQHKKTIGQILKNIGEVLVFLYPKKLPDKYSNSQNRAIVKAWKDELAKK